MKIKISRRQVLAAFGASAAGAAATGCSGPVVRARPATPIDTRAVQSFAAAGNPLLLQVVAHPDDELYFMNPDTVNALRAGVPVVTVYVTAGEYNGLNKIPGRPGGRPDKAAYASARHQGLRQAYAAMLGLPVFTRWRRSAVPLGVAGLTAEVNSLGNGRRKAVLVFLNLAMTGLPRLWSDPGFTLPTALAEGSPVRTVQTYRHDTLVTVLAGLMRRYRPTLVHTLDPDPEIEDNGATYRQDSEEPGYSDHHDHTAAALFTWKAMAAYAAGTARSEDRAPRFAATAYRGYYNHHWPYNLPAPLVRAKAAFLRPYGGDPGWACGNPGGCGDYNVGRGRPLTNRKGWVRSTHYRYPGARPAVTTGPDGRLTAFAVLGTRAVRWRETAPGSGRFGEPDDLGGAPLAPVLSAVRDAAGRESVFALRFASLDGDPAGNTREIVLLAEGRTGRQAWTGLGNPESDPDRGRRIGSPVAVATPDGRVHLFVRNAAKGLSTRVREAGGRWDPWRDLGGEVQDGLGTGVDRDGRVHVFAAGHTAVHHWTQGRLRVLGELPPPGDSPAVTFAADGTPQPVYRLPASAAVAVGCAEVRLPGYGPVAVAGGSPVGKGPDGEILTAGSSQGPLTGLVTGFPAVATGRLVGLEPNGTPWIRRLPRARTRT